MDVDFMLFDSLEVRVIHVYQCYRLEIFLGDKAEASDREKFGAGCKCR